MLMIRPQPEWIIPGKKGFAAVVCTRQVYFENVIPNIVWHFKKACRRSDAGAVDQDLHGSHPPSDHGAQCNDLFSVGNIAAECQRLTAIILEPLRQRLKPFLIARGNHNNGAATGKLHSDRFSNTSASAGYQRDFISEPRHSQKITHRLNECAIE